MGGLGCLVLIAAGLAARDWIIERWLLERLERGSLQEQSDAAKRLCRTGSARAVLPLLRCLAAEVRSRLEANPRAALGERAVLLQEALSRIGERALPTLIRHVTDEDPVLACQAACGLEWAHYRRRPAGVGDPAAPIPAAWHIDPVLRFLRDDERRAPRQRAP
jgi:hypothetical protein